MTEPAQLTRSRNEVMVAAWFQCTSLYIEGDPCDGDYQIIRRCPGTRMQAHHVKKRSAGGGHEPENLLPWCTECHEAFEQTPKRNGPFTDSAGRKFYTEDIGDRHEIRKVRVYNYLDFEAELEAEFIDVQKTLGMAALWGTKANYCSGFTFEKMDRLALWQMDPDLQTEDTSLGEYLRNRGLGIADSTLANYIRVARVFRHKKIALHETLDAIDECVRTHLVPVGFSAVRDNLSSIRRLEKPAILGLLSNTPSSDFKASITDHLEDKANQEAIAEGNVRVQMSATLTVEIDHTMTSVGSVEGDRKKLEGRLVSAIGKRAVPGSFRVKHHGEPVPVVANTGT